MNNWINPICYTDDAGALHFNAPALCELMGVAPTPENITAAIRMIRDALRDEYPKTPTFVLERDDGSIPPVQVDRYLAVAERAN